MNFFKKRKKVVAAFLLVNFLGQVVAPSIGYALTAGPTAPEFSSFEPVDTTDMVNLATGDFVYNTPLIEIPGPEGGYPLSLSYHAGIKLDQEASWVGLGWTLNPGAINRTVDGYADDNAGSKREVRDYWGGGTQKTKTYSLGVSIPNSGIGINYSLERVNNSYKGFSTNSYSGITFSSSVPSSYYPNQTSPLFRSIESQALSGVIQSTTLGISTATNGRGVFSLGDASLSKGETNNSAGKLTSFSRQTGLTTIPLPYMLGILSIRDRYTRFWSDESQALTNFGSLYPGLGNIKIGGDHYTNDAGTNDFHSYAFDIYDVYDGSTEDINVEENENDDPDAAKQLGGTLPAYDRYEVSGQGISGGIQPYIFENGDLYGQTTYERDRITGQPVMSWPVVAYKTLKPFSNKKVDFRFINDFSNSLEITPSQIKQNGTELYVDPNAIAALEAGFNNNELNQKLAGSRHIEWFTNDEIVTGTAREKGFSDFYKNRGDRRLSFDVYENYLQPEACIPYSGITEYGKGQGAFSTDNYESTDLYKDLPIPKFRSLKPKQADLKKKIGGFMITNESGVTYHYALPVYNYNEYTKSKLKKPQKDIVTFREYKNDDPYAYTWLLTAVTGPDYEDKDGNGVVSDGDIGYWVNLDYGRWADAYQWRSPLSGYMTDIESEYESFSYGIKELYYLDAIETRTHKAIFIKSKRKDGKGVTSRLEGGSNPRSYSMKYNTSGTNYLTYSVSPVSTMKLDAIYLFDKDDLASIALSKATGKKYNEAPTDKPYTYGYDGAAISYENYYTKEKMTIKEGEDFVYVKYHNGKLVYDDDDISQLPSFKEKALRIVEFDTDYSLAKETPNSFGFFSDIQKKYPATTCFTPNSNPCSELQKDFDFEWPLSSNKSCSFWTPLCCVNPIDSRAVFYGTNPITQFSFKDDCSDSNYKGNEFNYLLTGKLTLNSVKFLGKGGADLLPPTSFSYMNNQNYSGEMYDEWGYYKSDFHPEQTGYTRRITDTSATSVDAWSLQSIKTPIGSKIMMDYEAQEYKSSVYNDFSTFSIETLEPHEGGNSLVKVTFKEKGIDLNQWFKNNEKIDLNVFMVQNRWWLLEQLLSLSSYQIYSGHSDSDVINTVGDDYLIVESQGLRSLFTSYLYDGPYPGVEGEAKNIHVDPYFVGGFAKASETELAKKYTGGIRVRSLSIESGQGESSVSEYSYLNPSTGLSSGITSFKPYIMTSVQYPLTNAFFDKVMTTADDSSEEERRVKFRKRLDVYKNAFLRHVNETHKNLLTYMREVPAPGSIYEYVTVKNYTNTVAHEQYTTHHFKVFNETLVSRLNTEYSDDQGYKRNVSIKNKASDVGSILNVVTYNQQGDSLRTLNYGYLHDETTNTFEQSILAKKQGVVNQAFHKHLQLREYDITEIVRGAIGKNITGNSVDVDLIVLYSKDKSVVTKKEEVSNVLTSIEEVDHKKGLASKKENHAFDFYTGQVTKELSTDSYGHKMMSESLPAYTISTASSASVYPGMGLKVFNLKNKNMLTQSAASYSYQVNDALEPTGLLSASIQTWSDQVSILGQTTTQPNIWRKYSTYDWNGLQAINEDGSYPIAEWLTAASPSQLKLPFHWDNLVLNTEWEKTGSITLYDVFSHALEADDINGNFASTRMDPNQERVIASAANAAYKEMAYSGAEYLMGNSVDEGGVNRGAGSPSIVTAHTGNYSLLVNKDMTGYTYVLPPNSVDPTKKYKASVWLYVPGEGETQTELNKVQLYYSIDGEIKKEMHATVQKNKSKSWYLLELNVIPEGAKRITVAVQNLASRGVYFDDFRVHPLDASMTSYVYDQVTGELSDVLDGNNFYTHYQYDAMGRLIRTTRELLSFDYGPGKESFRYDQVVKEAKYNSGKNH